ncbi:sensor histidine kinase [Tenacibaculum retecalamus]|uniref:sensor histidine kinase n=1 Tax=Tenacibaculum retecalamus TaxID=3018315 RepID=UPI0023D91332|nr:histidine kinase [Tenacibaculum retecalamus]WBX72505.1 histidine kinase [Tenacibaculum retecalamus]
MKKDADAAQDYVLKLSDLMRFTIYDSGKESVLLKDEISYLINFIDLQTARYHKDIDVNFEKEIENANTEIAPLLFIILLENAFKHGVEKATDNAFVHLKLIEDNNKIQFTVKNNYEAEETGKRIGIGLKNLKERLNLLYPNSHQLINNINQNIYSTTLEIYKK